MNILFYCLVGFLHLLISYMIYLRWKIKGKFVSIEDEEMFLFYVIVGSIVWPAVIIILPCIFIGSICFIVEPKAKLLNQYIINKLESYISNKKLQKANSYIPYGEAKNYRSLPSKII